MKKRRRAAAAVITLLSLLTATGLFLLCFRVESKVNKRTYELGDVPSTDPSSYITGQDWSVKLAKVDASDVDVSKIGEYTIYIDHAWQHFTCRVTIEDTTPPELSLITGPVYVKTGDTITSGALVESATDLAGIARLTLNDNLSLSLPKNGVYDVTVKAVDGNGNETVKSLEVTADTPPDISGIREIYAATGSNFDLMRGIGAYDEVDGDVSESVSVREEQLDLSTPGDYEVTYSATDSYGLVQDEVNKVHVLEPIDLQEKLNQHSINYNSDYIYGAINPYDAGYYEGYDMASILEVMEPCVVHLYYPFFGGYSEGSGFIISVDDDYVYICTNCHVAKAGLERKGNCIFYDGAQAPVENVGDMDSDNDVAFVRVKKSDMIGSTLGGIKTVHLNYGYWNALGQNEGISLGFRVIKKGGTVFADRTGIMLQKEGKCDVPGTENWIMTEVTTQNFEGSSGSAVFDSKGNLVAMVRARSQIGYDNQYWCVTFGQIVNWYKIVFGVNAYYY